MLLRWRCAWLRYSSEDRIAFWVPPWPAPPWNRLSIMPRPREMSCCGEKHTRGVSSSSSGSSSGRGPVVDPYCKEWHGVAGMRATAS